MARTQMARSCAVAGSVDPGEEEDPDGDLIENGIEVAVLENSPL